MSSFIAQDTQCDEQTDCSVCGSGNDITPQKWNEVVRVYGPGLNEIGNGGSAQITSGSFFEPFQYFVRSLLSQLKPFIKLKIEHFIAANFGHGPVIGVHHRHGTSISSVRLELTMT
jgi:hypothetical protein